MFMHRFASSKKAGKASLSLMDIQQEPQETLREYAARFNMATLEVPEAESTIKGYAFTRGLKPGPLFDALQITPPKDFDDLLSLLPGNIQLEEAKAARKAEAKKNRVRGTCKTEERSEDRHPDKLRAKTPPPWSPDTYNISTEARNRVDNQEEDINPRPPKFDTYTPLNRSQEEIFHTIKNKQWFRHPGSYREGPPPLGPNNLLCEFHNRFGHTTEGCSHIRDKIEAMVRGGRLERFVRREEARG